MIDVVNVHNVIKKLSNMNDSERKPLEQRLADIRDDAIEHIRNYEPEIPKKTNPLSSGLKWYLSWLKGADNDSQIKTHQAQSTQQGDTRP